MSSIAASSDDRVSSVCSPVQDMGTCGACDELVRAKSRWCTTHHRAAECLRSMSLKGCTKTYDTPAGIAYKQVFGARATKEGLPTYDGDPDKAAQCVVAFTEQFPEGDKKTKKRGNVDITTFFHITSHHEVQENVSRRRRYDFQLFSMELKAKRGWSAARIKHEWDDLERNTSANDKDEGGRRNALFGCPFLPG